MNAMMKRRSIYVTRGDTNIYTSSNDYILSN